jgi:hypothetical protein
MIFTINTKYYNSSYKKLLKSKLKLNAIRRLRNFPINTTEKLLNNYLKENYNMTLIYACYLIILNSKVEESKDELQILIKDKQLDKIARIITFGTGRFLGSRIIPFIFGKY